MVTEKIAEVIVDIPSRKVSRVFDYAIPVELKGRVERGTVVRVPFGRTSQAGFVVALKDQTDIPRLAEISEVLEESVLTQEQIDLARWIAEYYLSSLSEALRLMLPPGRSRQPECFITLTVDPEEALAKVTSTARGQIQVVKSLKDAGGSLSLSALKSKLGFSSLSSTLLTLETKGFLQRAYTVSKPAIKVKKVQFACLKIGKEVLRDASDSLKKAPKQRAILELLAEAPEVSISVLLARTQAGRAVLKALLRKGWVELVEKDVSRYPDVSFPEETKDSLTLNAEQKQALGEILRSIEQEQPEVFLLQGVTGSGKTEIYLRAIAEVLKKGKGAIVLVPEISLTPQTVQRFKTRFGSELVAVLHSGLSLGERYDQWLKIAEGEYRVVVGARSAVFAPLKDLGLIVVDEEHESSYKQNSNPRYHARDVSVQRARSNQAVAVLGSATPSLESRFWADRGEYKLVALPSRVEGKELPENRVINMREVFSDGSKSFNSKVISPELQDHIKEAAEKGWKTILFLNRRGYSGFIQCRDCGEAIKCTHCEVTMTYHLTGRILKCHHCGHARKAPQTCPLCQSIRLGYFSVGTQRIENEIAELFPELPLIRMDADTTSRKGMHQKKLTEFLRSKKGILLGTQMIAKGLDFPEVTLVGIINADVALNLPDFRAGEHTFQLLMQVSGRAGRGEKSGLVLIQTYQPDNYAIKAVLDGSYDEFYRSEIKFRKSLNYPPFSRLINLVFSGKDEQKVTESAEVINRMLADGGIFEPSELLGPSPAPISKIKDHYRWHLVIKTDRGDIVKEYLRLNLVEFLTQTNRRETSLIIDVDPVTML